MYGQSGLQASKFVFTLYCFAKSLMQIATPNSTFLPRDEEGDEERDGEGDFTLLLSLPRFVRTGATATAIRPGTVGAFATIAGIVIEVTGPLLALTVLPEYGLLRTAG